MKAANLIIVSSFIILSTSCEKEGSENKSISLKKESISGFIQKGPFINGASIAISELNQDLNPTGKVFNTQISDNRGSFEIRNIELNSNFVEIIATGYYFNENTGKVSSSQLALHVLSDLSDSSTVNANILTELEKSRVVYLVSAGQSFKAAKVQAQKEILEVFEIEKNDMLTSEYLDITKAGEDNTILLAVSMIMQGLRTEAELSELIAEISSDMKPDGTINNLPLGQKLINDIRLINLTDVRTHISERYLDLGEDPEVSDFEKYVNRFMDSTQFEITNNIKYPENGSTGPNILSSNRLIYPSRTADDSLCTITADLPRGTSMKMIIFPDLIEISIDTTKEINPFDYSDYAVDNGLSSGWGVTIDEAYFINRSMTLFNTVNDRIIEAKFHLNNHGSATIEIYENNQVLPVRIKKIKW